MKTLKELAMDALIFVATFVISAGSCSHRQEVAIERFKDIGGESNLGGESQSP